MKLEFEYVPEVEEIRRQIRQCEGRHVQQAIYSTYHDALTQVCYGCRKIRSSINMAVDEDDGR